MLIANHQQPDLPHADGFLAGHSGELLILVLFILVVVTLMVLVPQLIKSHLRKMEMLHTEHLKALDQGILLPQSDEASKSAGRAAMLVPMVSVISAATVTSFLVVYRDTNSFSVSLVVWAVVGIVSLAAITGGVALLGRLAQLQSGLDEFPDENPPEEKI